jgi:predicted membrane metal-binding protein
VKEYNITFIATLFALTFSRFLGPRRAYWLIITGIAALYVLLVGADAAEIRAGLMGDLFVTALCSGTALHLRACPSNRDAV